MSARHRRRACAAADESYSSDSHIRDSKKGLTRRSSSFFYDYISDEEPNFLRRCSLSLDSLPAAIIRQIHSSKSTSNSPEESCSPRMKEMVTYGRERSKTYSISPRIGELSPRALFYNHTMEDMDAGISVTLSEPSEGGYKEQVKRSQSVSGNVSPSSREHDPVKGRSRSVNFFSDVEDNSEKRRLQRTPTPYWSRKEMGDDNSTDEDGIDYTPNYDPPDWGEGEVSAADYLSVDVSRTQRSGSTMESLDKLDTCGSTNSSTQETDFTTQSIPGKHMPPKQRTGEREEPEVPELYLNPLFRKVAAMSD